MFSIQFPNVCRPKPFLFKNDHIYPGTNKTDVPVVILYAEIGTKKFTSFHNSLSKKAEEGSLMYVLRHFVAVSRNNLHSSNFTFRNKMVANGWMDNFSFTYIFSCSNTRPVLQEMPWIQQSALTSILTFYYHYTIKRTISLYFLTKIATMVRPLDCIIAIIQEEIKQTYLRANAHAPSENTTCLKILKSRGSEFFTICGPTGKTAHSLDISVCYIKSYSRTLVRVRHHVM